MSKGCLMAKNCSNINVFNVSNRNNVMLMLKHGHTDLKRSDRRRQAKIYCRWQRVEWKMLWVSFRDHIDFKLSSRWGAWTEQKWKRHGGNFTRIYSRFMLTFQHLKIHISSSKLFLCLSTKYKKQRKVVFQIKDGKSPDNHRHSYSSCHSYSSSSRQALANFTQQCTLQQPAVPLSDKQTLSSMFSASAFARKLIL